MKHANGDVSKDYTFWEDPGHGWLQVTLSELRALGIERDITPCSYQSACGGDVYLEEDADVSTFLAAKLGGTPHGDSGQRWAAWFKENVCIDDRMTQRGAGEIFIRRLPSYRPPAAFREVEPGIHVMVS